MEAVSIKTFAVLGLLSRAKWSAPVTQGPQFGSNRWPSF
jgi:hypothetical protein